MPCSSVSLFGFKCDELTGSPSPLGFYPCRPNVWRLGLPRVLEYSSSTRVANYSSNILLLEYSLISISDCKFPFPVAIFCSHRTNCWNLCKPGASQFHLQHGNKSEYIHRRGATQPAAGLQPEASAQPCGTIDATSGFFGRPFIKRFALYYRTIVLCVCLVCLSVLSVCNVGVLWPNGWMDQDETCYRGRPLSRSHCVR